MSGRNLLQQDPQNKVDFCPSPSLPQDFSSICIAAGVRFRGSFPAFQKRDGTWHESVILFDDSHGSTLGLPQSQFNLENVLHHLATSEALWEKSLASKEDSCSQQ